MTAAPETQVSRPAVREITDVILVSYGAAAGSVLTSGGALSVGRTPIVEPARLTKERLRISGEGFVAQIQRGFGRIGLASIVSAASAGPAGTPPTC